MTSVAEILEQFEREWQAGAVPSISQSLDSLGERAAPAERRALLHEMVAIDLWHRWTRPSPPEVEASTGDWMRSRPLLDDYAHRYTEFGPLVKAPATVIREEYRVRRMHGEPLTPRDYCTRFAGREDFLDELKDLERELSSAQNAVQRAEVPAELPAPRRVPSGWLPGQPLAVRCPYCQAAVSTVSDALETVIHCSACNGAIRLVSEVAETRRYSLGSTIHHFKLIEQLGSGSFGMVYSAHDTKLERDVAIKIPRNAQLDSAEVAIFLREARSAAQLHHPNIVAVHEVGLVDDVPYIVSDLVRGVALSDELKRRRFTPREAAGLCAKVADALHHAHEAGVVHRDLKPGNLLLDAAGEPHLTDFGLARRTGAEATLTGDGQVLGTPAYMSPEQARGEGHNADRCSDVYSLGVMLFQMLTGELPFRGSANMMILQIIHDEPPSPRKLVSHLARDLETICLKCLEKSPARRYATAKELADDLRRYLRGEPIHARSVGRAERGVRWVMRNPVLAALSAAVVVALLAGTVASTLFALHARREAAAALVARETAETRQAETAAMFDFVDKRIFTAARPAGQEGGLGTNVTLRQALEAAVPYVDASFARQPLIEARLRTTLGSSFVLLGEAKAAMEQFQQARTLFTQQLGPNHAETLKSSYNRAVGYIDLGQYSEAAQIFEQILPSTTAVCGSEHPDTLACTYGLALAKSGLGRYDEALEMLERTLASQQAALGPEHADTLLTMQALAGCYENLGRFDDAFKLREKTFSIHRSTLGAAHPDTLASMNNLAMGHVSLGRFDDALKLFEAALAVKKRQLGEDHPSTLATMNNLAQFYNVLGRSEDARALIEPALARHKAKLGADHPHTLAMMHNLAFSYQALGRLADAIKLLEETLELKQAKLGHEHPDTATSKNNLAAAYSAFGRPAEALKLFENVLAVRKDVLGREHPDTLSSMNNLAETFGRLGRHPEAVKLHEETLALRQSVLSRDHPATISTMRQLSWLLATSPNAEVRSGGRALELATAACELTKHQDPAPLEALAAACAETGDFDQAIRWAQQALKLLTDTSDADLKQSVTAALDSYQAKQPIRDGVLQASDATPANQQSAETMPEAPPEDGK